MMVFLFFKRRIETIEEPCRHLENVLYMSKTGRAITIVFLDNIPAIRLASISNHSNHKCDFDFFPPRLFVIMTANAHEIARNIIANVSRK